MINKTNEEFEMKVGDFTARMEFSFNNSQYMDLIIKDEDNEDTIRQSVYLETDGLNRLKDIQTIINEAVKLLEERI